MIIAGQDVQVRERTTVYAIGPDHLLLAFEVGDPYRVHRVGTFSAILENRGRKAWIPLSRLIAAVAPAPDLPAEPAPERISINDPRIAYIWDAAHEVANNRGYCEEFDEIMKDIGAPARARDWQVQIRINAKEDEIRELLKGVPGYIDTISIEAYD
jgi:hypothetical protein